jgi:glucan phosphoethanolaminetransferase (alkaline phosphatase superfamily)
MSEIKDILSEKWFWIIVISLVAILVGSMLIVLIIVLLPPPFNAILTICIIIAWGVVAGYKEWLKEKK